MDQCITKFNLRCHKCSNFYNQVVHIVIKQALCLCQINHSTQFMRTRSVTTLSEALKFKPIKKKVKTMIATESTTSFTQCQLSASFTRTATLIMPLENLDQVGLVQDTQNKQMQGKSGTLNLSITQHKLQLHDTRRKAQNQLSTKNTAIHSQNKKDIANREAS